MTALAVEYPHEQHILRALIALFGLLLSAYLYFVSASVLNVIAEREASQRSASLESTIGSLEQHYFSLSEHVNPDSGPLLGLTPVKEKSYVYRLSTVGAIAEASNEI